MECIRCGQPTVGARCVMCGHNVAASFSEAGNAITWPFHQLRWPSSLWMPLLASFLWPFGMLIGLGWSVEAIGLRARSNFRALPQTKNLAAILKHGLVVMAMIFLYFILPLTVLYKLAEFSWLVEIWHLFVAVWRAITHTGQISLVDSFEGFLLRLLTNSLAPLLYLAFATPLFLVARLRYAITGQIRSFFQLIGNIKLCFRHIGEILLYLFLGVATRLAIGIILAIVAVSIVGIVIPAALGAANIWILAYLASNLARKMHHEDGIGLLQIASSAAPFRSPNIQAQPSVFQDTLPEVLPSPALRDSSALPVLFCLGGPMKNSLFPVSTAGYIIGRSPDVSQLIVGCREVSSRHVHVKADPISGEVWIEDMNSTNGTFYRCGSEPWQRLNGRVRLPHGARFKLSRHAAEFEITDA